MALNGWHEQSMRYFQVVPTLCLCAIKIQIVKLFGQHRVSTLVLSLALLTLPTQLFDLFGRVFGYRQQVYNSSRAFFDLGVVYFASEIGQLYQKLHILFIE